MTCTNLIAMCAKTHQPCPHAAYDGKCDSASCGNEVIPTYAQMVDIYCSVAKPPVARVGKMKMVARLISGLLGLKVDDKVVMNENDWDLVVSRMTCGTHPIVREGGYCDTYVKQILIDFKTMAGASYKAVRREYKKRGLVPPDCDLMPDISTKRREVEELNPKQVQMVKDKMVTLRLSDKAVDKRMYVWMWFAFYFGVRPADICRLKWDCIEGDPYCGLRLNYTPCKTEKKKKKNRDVGCAIAPSLRLKIEEFIGKPDEYVIPRMESRRPNGIVKHGEYCGKHQSLHKRVNKFFREEVGVKGIMKSYTMRRDCARYTIEHDGVLAEVQKLGHSAKVAFEHYTNPSKLNINKGGR